MIVGSYRSKTHFLALQAADADSAASYWRRRRRRIFICQMKRTRAPRYRSSHQNEFWVYFLKFVYSC